MRVLHVIASADPSLGGPIEGIRQLAPKLIELGHEVELVCCDDPSSTWLGQLPLKSTGLGPGIGRYAYCRGLVPWIAERADDFDVIVANGIWQYSSLAVRSACKVTKLPYVVFTHGMLDPWFKKAYPLKHLKKMLYWPWAEYRVLRDAAAVLFTCDEERLLASQSFRPYRVVERVVRYGTASPTGNANAQVAEFRRSHPQLGDRPFLLFLSRIHPKKGCDLLIEAFAKIAPSAPDLMLVMAGPDQVGWRAELEALATSLGVSDRIVWTGMLSGDLKWGAYHACEAFVLPSHQENFGIVVAEALACSKPVLITNKVNIWREIANTKSGFVTNDSIEATAGALSDWLKLDQASKSEMQSNALHCFEKNFELDAAAQSFIHVLLEAIDESRSR